MTKSVAGICSMLFGVHIITIIFNGTQYFTIGGRAIIYLIIILLSFLSIATNVLTRKIKITFNLASITITSFFMILYTILSPLYIHEDYQQDVLLSSLLFYIINLLWSNLRFEVKYCNFMKKTYVYSAVLLSIVLLLVGIYPYPGVSRKSIMAYNGEFYDVNFLAAFLLIPTIYLINDVLQIKSGVWVKLFQTVLCVIAILLTGSRSAIGLLVLSTLLLLWITKKIDLKYILSLSILVVLTIGVIPFLPLDIFEHYSRGFNPLEDQRRMLDWMTGIDLIEMKPLFGHGFIATKEIITRIFFTPWVTVHNTFIVFFVQYGLIFGLIATTQFALLLLKSFKDKILNVDSIAILAYILSIFIIESNFSDIMIIPFLFFLARINIHNNIQFSKGDIRRTYH